MRFNFRGIATKLIIFILSGCLLIFGILFGYNYYYSKRIIITNIQEIAENRTLATVYKVETIIRAVQELPENVAYLLENIDVDDEKVLSLVKTIVKSNSEIYGMAIAFEPYMIDGKEKKYSPYYYHGDGLKFKDLANEQYDYINWDWFKVPKELNESLWSEPYYDKGGGNIMMATYSVPFYRQINQKRVFRGVVTADIALTWLKDIINAINIADSGYAFIISKNGYIIHHPKIEDGEYGELLNIHDEVDEPSVKKVMLKMSKGESGFVSVFDKRLNERMWVSFAPIQSSRWSIGVVFPRAELMASMIRLHKTVIVLGFLGFIILFCVIALIASSITHPLRLLARKTNEISDGNLDVQFPNIESRDEVGVLARSFVNMRDSLQKYIGELTETTAEKQRMESELEIAKHIQTSMVPRDFPPFPEKKEIDLYASLIPAKQIGGDLYDYFFLDDERLCLIIGDVADKGVPAALLMAKSVTLLKSTAREISNPADILRSVNSDLAYENDSCIFVTAFLAILNIKTGELTYSNAGHNPPVLLRKNNKIQFVEDAISPVLGAIEGCKYTEGKVDLIEDDVLFMYTDGVTEAFDKEYNEFSNERLADSLSNMSAHSAREIANHVLESVKLFSKDAGQSDDIAVLALRYLGENASKKLANGKHKAMTIVLENRIGELVKLTHAINSFGKANNIKRDALYEVELALEEIFTNTVSYGYKDDGIHSIKIDIELAGNEIRVQMEDDAIAFNPLDAPEVDTEKPLDERLIGGLGLHLVKMMTDKISYERAENKNILRIECKV